MVSRRIVINLAIFLLSTSALIALGISQLLLTDTGGPVIRAEFTNSGGLALRNDVTMRGVNVGAVTDVGLTEDGTMVEMTLDSGTVVPNDSDFQITRRSPIGDLVVEVTPGEGEPLAAGEVVPVANTSPPPDAGRTVEVLADVLGAVPAEDLSTVVSELADALEGRGNDLAMLSEATADLPESILTVRSDLEALIRTGPEVTGVLADNADVLADDITRTAQLADILRDSRFDLVDLYSNGASFTRVANELIVEQKPNISCLIRDFARINTTLGGSRQLSDLVATLQLNPLFFDAVEKSVQTGLDGRAWFRVQLLPHQEPAGRTYVEHRKTPDVFGGNSCISQFGIGVGPTTRKSGDVPLAPDSQVHDGR